MRVVVVGAFNEYAINVGLGPLDCAALDVRAVLLTLKLIVGDSRCASFAERGLL